MQRFANLFKVDAASVRLFYPALESKCQNITIFVQQQSIWTQTHMKCNVYKPKVQDTKSRNSSKPRKTPIISCKRKEFNFYEGMKYGKFEAVPLASQGWLKRGSNGDFFSLYENYMNPNELHFGYAPLPKTTYSPDLSSSGERNTIQGFASLGIEKHLVESLRKVDIKRPADIQVASIPHVLQGKNCIISAHTGCGKTLAYLLPVIQQVLESNKEERSPPHGSPKAIILSPSRELSYQIFDVIQKLTEGLPISAKLVVGGYEELSPTRNDPPEIIDIVVGSLGTLDRSFRTGVLSKQRIKYIVLDEADQLVDDQNRGKVRHLLKTINIRINSLEGDDNDDDLGAQVLLVSATIPLNLEILFEGIVDVDSIERITTTHLHNVLKSSPQLFLKVGQTHKAKTLVDLIEKDHKLKRPVLIFSNTAKTAEWVGYQLDGLGYPCKTLTSHVPTEIRQHLFQQFQQGEFNILSSTPMIARGLDTIRVQHVINFDFPLYVSEYIHQIGRVGRIGQKVCHITNIVAFKREVELVQKIELSVRLNQKLQAVNANIQGILSHRHANDEDDQVENPEEDSKPKP
ncbi:putative ATP-dependent RNA helicase DDX28 [Frankliniella fusca]|uniref:ATP-dependent RNA helicase DDX28 n=1 Tax=Frankliniella fusca TaxID=407009 RepID=A0AAE1GTZ9_9NEOP|nr:putative ATP-dependent RNA helicase DDX28 [Frankliniella fusca]